MWQLKFGVNPQGELITISEVNSGKTNLVCPFCDSQLTAKKGKIKQHHFAHSDETCLRVRKGKFPSLPLYDNFHLHLSAKHLQLVKDLWREYGNSDATPHRLRRCAGRGVLETNGSTLSTELKTIKNPPSTPAEFLRSRHPNSFRMLETTVIHKGKHTEQGNAHQDTDYAIMTVPFELELKKLFSWTPEGYYFTDLGKIPVGGLSLSKFNAVQEPLILSELNRLNNSVEMARVIGGDLLEEKLADLKIYQLQLQRILRFTLYFLEIKADGKTLHKIGVTSRTMGDRLTEIERDLKQHYSKIAIDVLGTWQHRGNVELYFKHRYNSFNYRIGKLTEYYKFKNIESVLDDLYSMQQKVLKSNVGF